MICTAVPEEIERAVLEVGKVTPLVVLAPGRPPIVTLVVTVIDR